MERGEIRSRDQQDASEMSEEEDPAKSQFRALSAKLGVAKSDEDGETDDAERGQSSQQSCRMRRAGKQQGIRAEKAGQQKEPAQQMPGEPKTKPCLRGIALGQGCLGIRIQQLPPTCCAASAEP
jgi:hypothetical protein